MEKVLKLAVVGAGRIGVFHAQYLQELGQERGDCELVAVVDTYQELAGRVARQLQAGQMAPIRAFTSVEALLAAGLAEGAIIASRTEDHEADARRLISAGYRVLLEKPLTHSLASARVLAAYLNEEPRRRQALMQAFMRRFDVPLQYAKQRLDSGVIGTPFKIVSVLEDPLPPPKGYKSPGLVADMAVHNIDEIIWLTGARPVVVKGLGSRLHNYKISPVAEDLDDAFLQMGFDGDLSAQVQVSRNHVAGYRNETWIYGDKGLIHVGHFQGKPLEVGFEAYGRGEVIERRTFALRDHGRPVPVFIDRFGPAYKTEIAHFIDQCRRGQPFAVDHNHGLQALVVAEAGNQALQLQEEGVRVEYS